MAPAAVCAAVWGKFAARSDGNETGRPVDQPGSVAVGQRLVDCVICSGGRASGGCHQFGLPGNLLRNAWLAA